MDETGQTSTDVDAPIVWMGYGIDAPEFNWNDYKDVDVKGKVLLMMVNEPPSDDPKFFNGKALTYYGRWTYKYEEAARKGAAGVILIHKTDMASYGWDVVRNSWSGERSYLRNDPAPKLKVASWIQLDVARKLAQDCGMNLDEMMAAAQKPGFKARAAAGDAEGAHRQQGAALRFQQRGRDVAGRRMPAERPGRDVQRALRSPGHRAGHAGRQHLQRRAGQRDRRRHPAGDRAGLQPQPRSVSAALRLLCLGHGRGARVARLGVLRQASAGCPRRKSRST